MAYGDITGSPHAYRAPSIPGVQTARRAVLLKDDTTFGSNARLLKQHAKLSCT